MPEPQRNENPETLLKKLSDLRGLIGKVVVGLLMVSGWVFLFSQPAPTVTTSKDVAKQAEQNATGIPGSKEPEPEGTFVLSYSLVILTIGLGLMFITGSSNRRDRAHNQQYEGVKVTADEAG